MAGLTVSSYNSQGHGDGRWGYMQEILDKCDIMFIQEHWLLQDEIGTFAQKLKNACVHGVSGMPDDTLHCGRPYGGCAIVWKADVLCRISPVLSDSGRLCAVRIENAAYSILIINVYMPCDSNTDANLNEFTEVLGEDSSVCQLENTVYGIIGGDFNADCSRLDSLRTRSLRGFISSENLIHVGITEGDNHVYTYESKANGSRSFIDHFLISDGLNDNVST